MCFLFICNANCFLGTKPAATAVLFHFVAAQLPNCWINLTLKTIVLLKNVTVLVFYSYVAHLFPADITCVLKGHKVVTGLTCKWCKLLICSNALVGLH